MATGNDDDSGNGADSFADSGGPIAKGADVGTDSIGSIDNCGGDAAAGTDSPRVMRSVFISSLSNMPNFCPFIKPCMKRWEVSDTMLSGFNRPRMSLV